MNETYLVHDDTPTPNIFATTNNADEAKGRQCCLCRSTFWFIWLIGALTFAIIGGFSFLFGPLVLKRASPLHGFTPSQISVLHYRLRLEPNATQEVNATAANSFDFCGRASIIFNNARRTNQLRLVAQDLHVERMHLTLRTHIRLEHGDGGGNSSQYHVVNVTEIAIKEIDRVWGDAGHAELCITLATLLQVGDYMLDVHYVGAYHPLGLARSTYQDVAGNNASKVEKYLIQLKDAARVLPYFDNRKKCTFEVSLARRTDVLGFSNVAFKEVEAMKHRSGYIWEHFRTTPAILPQSLALIIADFAPVNLSSAASPVILKMFAPRKQHERLAYAAAMFPRTFAYFEEYFEAPYPLTKLDLVHIDDDTAAATWKPGLITLDSERLLVHALDAPDQRRRVLSALCEAVAHQWLRAAPNLHENDALIEAFAKFLAFDAQVAMRRHRKDDFDDARTQDDDEMDFVEGVLEPGMHQHGAANAALKMAAVLRMINGTLGARMFRMGANKFLAHSDEEFWQSAELLHLLGNQTGKQLLLSWWQHAGHPVVTVMRTTGWNWIISQQSALPERAGDVFTIPLTYISQRRRDVAVLTLGGAQIEANLNVPRDEWMLFNYNCIGFYRVNYHRGNWQQLIKQLHAAPSEIPAINRVQLINDAFALADDGLLHYDVPFELINYLRRGNESNYGPWLAAITALNRHEAVLLDSAEYGVFRKFKVTLLTSLWHIRNQVNTKLSTLLHQELCALQFKPCVDAAAEAYDKYKGRRDIFVPHWVYCTVVAHPPEATFAFLYARMKESTSHREVLILLQSLTCTKTAWQLNSLLDEFFENINYAKHLWPALAKSSLGRLAGMMYLEAKHDIEQNDTALTRRVDWARQTEVWKIIVDKFLSTMSRKTHLQKIQRLAIHLPQAVQGRLHAAMRQVNTTIEWNNKYLSRFLAEMTAKP